MLWAGPSLAAVHCGRVGLLLATALSGAAAEGLGAGYPGPMDFNCTSPPLNVSFGDPIGPIACGTQLKKANPALKTAPTVAYAAADAKKGYTIMMIDPDAPSHDKPTYSPIRHWLVVNVPGHVLKKGYAVRCPRRCRCAALPLPLRSAA